MYRAGRQLKTKVKVMSRNNFYLYDRLAECETELRAFASEMGLIAATNNWVVQILIANENDQKIVKVTKTEDIVRLQPTAVKRRDTATNKQNTNQSNNANDENCHSRIN